MESSAWAVQSDSGAISTSRAGHDVGRLSLLAHSVSGRRLHVVEDDVDLAHCVGDTIRVPAGSIRELEAIVIIQSALTEAGSFDPAAMARLVGHPRLRSRYLVLECLRAARRLSALLPVHVLTGLADVYDGPSASEPRESLVWARERSRSIPDPPSWLGEIRPVAVLRERSGSSVGDDAPDSRSRSRTEDVLRTLDVGDAEPGRDTFLETFTLPVQNPFASRLKNMFGGGQAPDGPPGARRRGADDRPVHRRLTTPDAVVDKSRVTGNVEPDGIAAPVEFSYPEWNHGKQTYRPDWCRVAETTPATGENLPWRLPADAALRRQLARLEMSPETHRRQQHGDDLDLTALVDHAVDIAAGSTADAKIYEMRRRTVRDLGVLVLLDSTGSTGASKSGRTVFEEHRDVAAQLASSFDALGDRVAVYGFCSRGRKAVRFARMKSFDERYGAAVTQRLAALEPGGFTRLGAAIRHGSHLLDAYSGARRRLLVLVGDGFPYESGYEDRYAQEDSRKALREAVTAGVGCACISPGSDADPATLDRVWGDVPYRRIDGAASLAALSRRCSRRPSGPRPPGNAPSSQTAEGRDVRSDQEFR